MTKTYDHRCVDALEPVLLPPRPLSGAQNPRPPSASQDKSQLVDSRLQRLVIVQLFALYCRTIPNIADNWRQTRRFLRVRSLRCEAAGSVVCRDLREAIQPSMLRHCCFSILSTFAPNFGFSNHIKSRGWFAQEQMYPSEPLLKHFWSVWPFLHKKIEIWKYTSA